MTTFYKVGKIVNTQGLRGEVRVISTTDLPKNVIKKEQNSRFLKMESSLHL